MEEETHVFERISQKVQEGGAENHVIINAFIITVAAPEGASDSVWD